MDQTLSNIHVLSKFSHQDINNDRLYALMDKNSFMIMLKAGSNFIYPSQSIISKKSCGFFPIGEQVENIHTQGLKWNMGNHDDSISKLDWKTFVSSSNEIVDETVQVNTSHDVLFVASIVQSKLS